MKKATFMAMMVAVSTIATAQESYRSHNEAKDYEWYFIGTDTSSIYIKGDTKYVRGIVYRWMRESNIDPSKPTQVINNKVDSYKTIVWDYENEYDNDVKLLFNNRGKRSDVVISILE